MTHMHSLCPVYFVFSVVFSPNSEWKAVVFDKMYMKNRAECTKQVLDCLSEVRREYQRMAVLVTVTGGERQLQQQLREKEEQVRG